MRGGHAWFEKKELSKEEKQPQLDLSKKGDQVSVAFQKQATSSETKLDLKNEKQLDISQVPSNYSSGGNISGIFKEITKEKRVTGIESQVQEKFQSLTQTTNSQSSHWSNFRTVKRDVKEKWLGLKEKLFSLPDTQSIPSLSTEKRKSLMAIFQLYKKLKESKKNFFEQFQNLRKEIDVIISSELETTDSSVLGKIEKALTWIRWSSSGRVMLDKSSSSPYNRERFVNNWGEWNDNPFRHFYDSEQAFNQDLEFLNKLRKKIKQQIKATKNQQYLVSSSRVQQQLAENITETQKFLDSSAPQKHVEIRVAEKLLKHMGQLD